MTPRELASKENKEYQCAFCKKVFDRVWSDEEASAEFHHNFPECDLRSAALVCDDCYKQFMGYNKQ